MYLTESASLVEARIPNQALILAEGYRLNPVPAMGGMVFFVPEGGMAVPRKKKREETKIVDRKKHVNTEYNIIIFF